jgi:DNA-binding NtrC family response regulator
MIVDDDEDLRQALADYFRRLGAAVTAAASAEDALAAAAHTPVDVALLDLHLPGIDGLELLARLKGLQPEAEALLPTAHGSVATAVEAMRRGAYDYLTKPFRLPETTSTTA